MIYNIFSKRDGQQVARIEAEGKFDLEVNFKKIFPKEEFAFVAMNYGEVVKACEHRVDY